METNFIKVTAVQSNDKGETGGQAIPIKMEINPDLIGAIRNGEILLKGGKAIYLSGNYYTNFRLVTN